MEQSRIHDPDPRAKMTLQELASFQTTASSHMTFSLTLACPLKCAHCIVNAGPDKGYTTMPLEVAKHYAGQTRELFDRGIRTLSFTGGEPLIARRQLRTISDAAGDAGMQCGVVTAAHWASDGKAALKVVESFPAIGVWDLSIDSYHEPFVSFDRVRIAYEAVRRAGRRATIRFTYHDPLTSEDRRVMAFIAGFADEADLCSQKVRQVGRGGELGLADSRKFHPWNKPCVTQGMVVRYDGTLAPCCVNMVEQRDHPFQLGDARHRRLTVLHQEYMSLPLLQMIRTIGFTDLIEWLQESGLDRHLPASLPDDVCDLCPILFTHPRMGPYLSERASKPANLLRIAVLASRLLNEHGMLRRVVARLSDELSEVEGLDLAQALLREVDETNSRDTVERRDAG